MQIKFLKKLTFTGMLSEQENLRVALKKRHIVQWRMSNSLMLLHMARHHSETFHLSSKVKKSTDRLIL